MDFINEYWHPYLSGLGVTLLLTLTSMALSLVLGTVLGSWRNSQVPALRLISAAYVALFRGVPPLLAFFLVYFGLPSALGEHNAPFNWLVDPLNNQMISATIALGLVSAAYSAEIIRAAIASLPHGQVAAARSLGMLPWTRFRRVVIPQAARVAIPPLTNETITVLKGTSLASVIGVVELTRAAQEAASATFRTLLAYSMAGVFYVLLVLMLQLLLGWVERTLDPMRRVEPVASRQG